MICNLIIIVDLSIRISYLLIVTFTRSYVHGSVLNLWLSCLWLSGTYQDCLLEFCLHPLIFFCHFITIHCF